MALKIQETLQNFFEGDKKLKIFVAIGVVGILLILLSEAVPKSSQTSKNDEYSYEKYIISLEKETSELVEAIDGAGKCRIMLTLQDTKESVYAKNSSENTNNGSYSVSSEYVLYKGQDGETPVLVKERFPKIKGVAVVCEGGDNMAVRETIINCLSAVFDIPSSKISVSKLKE